MQKREALYCNLKKQSSKKWLPAPCEWPTLSAVNNRAYLIGGINFDASKEVACLKIGQLTNDNIDILSTEWASLSIN